MKFRVDFVTNSSSSSFLLADGYDEQKFHDHIKRKIKEFQAQAVKENLKEQERHYREDHTGLVKHLEECDRDIDMDELDNWALHEIYEWYEDDVIAPILAKAEPDRADRRKLFQWGLLAYAELHAREESLSFLDFHAKVTKEFDMNVVWEYNYGEQKIERIRAFLSDHYEEFLAYSREAAAKGYTYARLFKEFLGCSKGYYSASETHYLVIDAVAEFEECKFSCCHMG